jgi:hypothetical protein
MPAFLLSELAPFLGKDEATLRRWCKRGTFGCSAYQTKGPRGRWKVRGKSVAEIAERTKGNAQEFSRRRLTRNEVALRDLSQQGNQIAKSMRALAQASRLSRQGRMGVKYMTLISRALADKTDQELDALGLSQQFVERLAWQPLTRKQIRAAFAGALCVWMMQAQDASRSSIARAAGISRRTLCRVFGRYWRAADVALTQMQERGTNKTTAKQRAGVDRRTGRQLFEPVETVMPEGAAEPTENQLRAWSRGGS